MLDTFEVLPFHTISIAWTWFSVCNMLPNMFAGRRPGLLAFGERPEDVIGPCLVAHERACSLSSDMARF